MKVKTIKSILNKKHKNWLASISDKILREKVKNSTFITGGAIPSLLTGNKVSDYDIYFTDPQVALETAQYYAHNWNVEHSGGKQILLHNIKIVGLEPEDERDLGVEIVIPSSGAVKSSSSTDDDNQDEGYDEVASEPKEGSDIEGEESKPKYKPIFITDNAITLSGKIQLILRFVGTPNEIHKNFDFIHCTCYYFPKNSELVTPNAALLSIMTKELQYVGSKFPLCSLFRLRKFYQRGYVANAGQIVKIAFQLNQLNLMDINVLKEQLIGVDTLYMRWFIDKVQEAQKEGKEIDQNYLMSLIEELFDTPELK